MGYSVTCGDNSEEAWTVHVVGKVEKYVSKKFSSYEGQLTL